MQTRAATSSKCCCGLSVLRAGRTLEVDMYAEEKGDGTDDTV